MHEIKAQRFGRSLLQYSVRYFLVDAGRFLVMVDIPSRDSVSLFVIAEPDVVRQLQDWDKIPPHTTLSTVAAKYVPGVLRAMVRAEVAREFEAVLKQVPMRK